MGMEAGNLKESLVVIIGGAALVLGFFIVPEAEEILPRSIFPSGSGWSFAYTMATSIFALFSWIIFGAPALLIFIIADWFRGYKFTKFLFLPVVLVSLSIATIGGVLTLRFVLGWIGFLRPDLFFTQ